MEALQSYILYVFAGVQKIKGSAEWKEGGGSMLFYDTAIILTPTPLDKANMGHVHSQLSRQFSVMKGFEDVTWT